MEMQELLDEYRIPYDTSGRGKNRIGWLNMRCPYCGRDPYLGYSIEGKAFSCWNCGKHSVVETVVLLTGMDHREAIARCKNIPSNYVAREKLTGKLELPDDLGPLLGPHKKYLKSRNLDPDKAESLWNLQGIGRLGGKLAWRIFIPVHVNGEIVTWTTRRLTNVEPRYHSARPEQSKLRIDHCLYGIDYARTSIIVVEGPGDVWRIGPGASCTFGTRVSSAQVERIAEFPVRCFLFDAGARESEAQRRSRELANRVAVMPGQTFRVTLETGKDPGSCDPSELEEIRREFLR